MAARKIKAAPAAGNNPRGDVETDPGTGRTYRRLSDRELRLLFKVREPASRKWNACERGLVQDFRKASDQQKLQIMIVAQNAALDRIRAGKYRGPRKGRRS
jgi:hypothetical protein